MLNIVVVMVAGVVGVVVAGVMVMVVPGVVTVVVDSCGSRCCLQGWFWLHVFLW